MKKVVYTACFGLDLIRDPIYCQNGWDYIFFTDNKSLKSDKWHIEYLTPDIDQRRFSRKVKILNEEYLPGYDLSLYIDARFIPRISLDKFVKNNLENKDIAMMRHHKRSCIYDEAKICIDIKKDSEEIIKEQMARYRSEGYPNNNGLTAGGIILRKHGIESQREFMQLWYEEIKNGSWRDQLSFQYVLWKHKLNIGLMDFKKVYESLK